MADERNQASARVLIRYPMDELERANRLLADYRHGKATLRAFFPHHPTAITANVCPAQSDRPSLASALTAYQQYLGADGAAVMNAHLLADPSTPVITTGQQSGLLTGPLYTLFKALTAINQAAKLSAQLHRSVVPVFWLATDDDDIGEADHGACWDDRFTLHPLQYSATAETTSTLIGDLPTGRDGEAVLEQLSPLLANLPYADDVSALLQQTLAASSDMGEWSACLLSRLLSPFGLVICDPRLPELRRLSAEIIRRELAQPLASSAQVNARAKELQLAGYRPQLTKPSDACNCFLLDGHRRRISFRDGHFLVGDKSYAPVELLTLLDDAPERFAPNAVLRPVVQEYLFNSAAFVSGPNELGYWAELAPVFDTMTVPMPPVIVRAGATFVPAGMARDLRRLDIDPLALYLHFDHLRLDLLARALPASVMHSFSAAREDIARMVAHLTDEISVVESTLAQSAPAVQQRMLNELDRLERKTLKAIERKSADHVQRLDSLRDTLFPQRGLQERALNLFGILARYGFDVLPQLLSLLNEQEGYHLFVEL